MFSRRRKAPPAREGAAWLYAEEGSPQGDVESTPKRREEEEEEWEWEWGWGWGCASSSS